MVRLRNWFCRTVLAKNKDKNMAIETPPTLLKVSQVEKITSASKASLYRWIAAGHFPPPVKIGPQRVAWRATDVIAWTAKLTHQ